MQSSCVGADDVPDGLTAADLHDLGKLQGVKVVSDIHVFQLRNTDARKSLRGDTVGPGVALDTDLVFRF